MATMRVRAILRHLQRQGNQGQGPGDKELLERFVQSRDEAAFEVLVWRHGALVLGLCQRMLRHQHDAEDAFQATFLTFFRKAGSISKRAALSSWLYKVAYRIALRARLRQGQQPGPLNGHVQLLAAPADDAAALSDLRPLLDEEIQRLPAHYRLPVILCYLEGKTNAEAAQALSCPRGTIGALLTRARKRLRSQLVRRGIALGVAVVDVALVKEAQGALPSPALVQATTQIAFKAVATSGVASHIVALSEGVVQAMFWTRVKALAAAVLILGILATSTGVLTYQAYAGPGDEDAIAQRQATQPAGGQGAQDAQQKAQAPQDALEKEFVRLRERLALAQQRNAELQYQLALAQSRLALLQDRLLTTDTDAKKQGDPSLAPVQKLLKDLIAEIDKLGASSPVQLDLPRPRPMSPAICKGLHLHLTMGTQCTHCHKINAPEMLPPRLPDPSLKPSETRPPREPLNPAGSNPLPTDVKDPAVINDLAAGKDPRLTPAAGAQERHKQVAAQMQGRWLVHKAGSELFQGATGLVIMNDKILVERPGWDHRISFTLDAGQRPLALDLTPGPVLNSWQPGSHQAIAQLETVGTELHLTLCFSDHGQPRPQTFQPSPKQHLVILKRVLLTDRPLDRGAAKPLGIIDGRLP